MDIHWILAEEISATKVATGHYLVSALDGKNCNITFSPEGRMLFDGQDIETEDFMAYVGLLDMIDDGETHFEADAEC